MIGPDCHCGCLNNKYIQIVRRSRGAAEARHWATFKASGDIQGIVCGPLSGSSVTVTLKWLRLYAHCAEPITPDPCDQQCSVVSMVTPGLTADHWIIGPDACITVTVTVTVTVCRFGFDFTHTGTDAGALKPGHLWQYAKTQMTYFEVLRTE